MLFLFIKRMICLESFFFIEKIILQSTSQVIARFQRF